MKRNPFKPTAGKNPPAVIGREYVLDEFLEGIENGPGAPSRLMRISGIRGMGKTVMLNEIGDLARELGWVVIDETASEGFCERILAAALPLAKAQRVTVEPSVLGVSLGSVELERMSLTLRQVLDQAIRKNGKGLLITLDEVQDASIDEVRALAVAVQHEIREDADIAFVFAGLPSMIENVVNGKTLTFLRRAVPVDLRPVGLAEVAASMAATMQGSGMELPEGLARELAALTQGYPFMIQLAGYHVWQAAKARGTECVDAAALEAGFAAARERFDATVIEPALQRLPPTCVSYLLAMAQDHGASSESGNVAKRLGKSASQVSPYRARLIDEDVIEASGWGVVSFAIPYMADYLNANRERIAAAGIIS